MKILIVEDNIDLCQTITSYMVALDYVCEVANRYDEALQKIALYDYDCILLDITLPGGGSGLDLLNELAKNNKQDCVIIISAKDSLEDKILGLELGADDYLTKPFHLEELAIRVFSVVRRKLFKGGNSIQYQQLRINLLEKSCRYNNETIPQLSSKEFSLLLLFITSPHRIITKESIAEHLLGDNADMFDNFDCIYAHVKNLKKKLRQAGCTDYIKSIYGMGYKFDN